jgi:large subunit ribosomal protein L34e
VYLYLKKARTVPKCGQCKEKLKGIQPTRPSERPRLSRRLKTVSRTFGGVLCHRCLRERIVRAFLIDEQKLVKVLKAAQATSVKAPKAAKVAKPTKAAAAKPPSKTPAPAPKVAKGAAGKTSKAPAKTPAAAKKGKK